MPASARASRLTRHGGEACVPRHPMCRLAFDAARCRVVCLPPLPSLALRAARRCCCEQRAGERGDGHRPGAFEARRLHVDGCAEGSAKCGANAPARTRDDTATASRATRPMARQDARQRAASRRPSWAGFQPDWMRDPDHGGCADRPKYRLSNDAGLVTLKRNSSPDSRRRHCCQDGSGRPSGRQAAEGTPSMRRRGQCCTTPAARRRPRAEQRHARRQVAAARPARRRLAAAWSGRCCPRTRDVAASRCRGLADRRDTSRPPRCRTGCRSGAAADAKDAQASAARPQADRPANTRRAQARARRDAGCAGNGGWKRHGSVLRLARQRAARRCIRAAAGVQRAGWRACASTRARQRRARCPAPRWRRCTPAPRAPGSPLRRGAAARRLHAGDALRCIQRRASLHHHELPTHSAVVVGLPADTAQHGARQEHRATAPAVELVRARRFAEAQVELEAWFDVGKRHARQRRAGRLAGKCSRSRASGRRSGCSHGAFSLRCSGNSRSNRPRSRSATVTPCVKADT